MFLAYNELTGSIAETLARLPSLEYVSLSHNQLTGPIPSATQQLANLQWIRIAGNGPTGCLPGRGSRLLTATLSFLVSPTASSPREALTPALELKLWHLRGRSFVI